MMPDVTYKKFDDCIENVKYTTKIQSKDYLSEGKFPIISQEDELISGYWNDENDVFHIARPLVIFGDHTRILKYVDFDFVLGADGVKILLPIKDLNAKFLLYYLKWYNVPSLGYSRHFKLLREIPIPIPSLDIQQSIVRELDAINAIIADKKQQLAELDTLAQAIFYNMFGDPITNDKGWEVKKLGEVGIGKMSYGSGASAIPFNNELRYVRITDITESGALNNDAVSPSVVDDKYLLHEGDILFARSGATVGKTYLHKACDGHCLYAGYLIRLVPNKNIVHPTYVFHYTKTNFYLSFIEKTKRAVAQPNINAQEYGNLPIPLPPLPLQQAFAEKIEAIEEQKSAVRASLTEFESLLAQRLEHHFA